MCLKDKNQCVPLKRIVNESTKFRHDKQRYETIANKNLLQICSNNK